MRVMSVQISSAYNCKQRGIPHVLPITYNYNLVYIKLRFLYLLLNQLLRNTFLAVHCLIVYHNLKNNQHCLNLTCLKSKLYILNSCYDFDMYAFYYYNKYM